MKLDGTGSENGIKVVFFDAGETLVHPHPSFIELFEQTCAGNGTVIDTAGLPAIAGGLLSGLEKRQRAGYTFSTSTEVSRAFWLEFYESLLAGLGHAERGDLARELYRVFTDPSNYTLYEDVIEAMHGLERKGLEIGLISNFEVWLEELLDHLGILGFFRHVLISGRLGTEKPDRRIFEIALERAGVTPRQALHVGDSIASDVEGARSAGLIPVMIDRYGLHPDIDCLRLTDLRQLVDMFEEKR